MAKRSRTERRAKERALRRLVQKREKLVRISPGGSPENPLLVGTASVVEVQALSTPCHQCEGSLELLGHAAEVVAGEPLRRLELRCRRCHAPRQLWFRIAPRLPN